MPAHPYIIARKVRASQEFKDFIVNNYRTMYRTDLARLMRSTFGIPVTADYISRTLYRMGLRQARPPRHAKPPVPWGWSEHNGGEVMELPENFIRDVFFDGEMPEPAIVKPPRNFRGRR